MFYYKSNSAIVGFDKLGYNKALKKSFSLLNLLQSANFEIKPNRVDRKFIGSSASIKGIYTYPEILLNIEYLQDINFSNEELFGFNLNKSSMQNETILKKLKNNFLNQNAFLILNEENNNDIIFQIRENGFSESMVAFSFGNLFLQNYSFSYKVNSPTISTASFIVDDFKISNLINQSGSFYLNSWNNELIQLQQSFLDSNFYNNTPYRKNYLSLGVKDFNYSSFDIEDINFPSPKLDNLAVGNIQELNFSFSIERNKFLSLNNGSNKPYDRSFMYPVKGLLNVQGITSELYKKSLSEFLNSDKKFSLVISLGKKDLNLDYTEIYFDNLYIESYSTEVNLTDFINYNIQIYFEINENDGFKINVLEVQDNPFLYVPIKTSDGHSVFAQDLNNPSQQQRVVVRL